MPRLIPMLLVAGAFSAAALPLAGQTTGYLLPCSATRQLGRGCTSQPGSPDAGTILRNPAGLADITAATVSLNGGAFMPSLRYSNTWNAAATGARETYPIPAVLYAQPLNQQIAFGVGAQTLGGMGAEYRLTHPLLGPDQRYHSEFGLMQGGVAFAYRPIPELSLGATLGALYGQLEFATPYSVSPSAFAGLAALAQDPDYAPLFSSFTEATAYAQLTGLSGLALAAGASAEYRPSPRVAVSLAYTAPATLTLKGGAAAMDLNAQFGQLYQALVAAKGGDAATVNAQLAAFGVNPAAGMATQFDAQADFGIPQTVTLGLAFQPATQVSLSADAEWIGYQAAFKDMPLRLSGGTNTNINILMNANPSDGSFSTTWPMEWKNAVAVRGGVEYRLRRGLGLRAGGLYGSNPVPDRTLFTIFPAIVQGAATVGLSYQLGRATVDIGYAHTFASEERAATPHDVAQEYANSTNRLLENLVSAGFTWRF